MSYYQDQSKFGIIARFNDLEDATKLYAGMKLKIPEIEGVRFSQYQTEEVGATADKGAPGDSSVASEQEMDYDPVGIYQEQGVSLLEEGEYLAALHEF
ncbi:MAG: hypothetical protein ACFFG0_55220, partial [Candidatus Thorarchaeota archaeon]